MYVWYYPVIDNFYAYLVQEVPALDECNCWMVPGTVSPDD